ncbi:hypothetical protein ACRDNQ_04020 [Palleronia sp. KMU-117]|uniref:hypothetical protein n=1 Tax=Palleronia sp. KMU-117 TaxID=3434108 RepID=UPI003D74EAAF
MTPIGEHKVVIKTLLTAAERERVDAAQMDYVDTSDGKTFTVKDMKKVATAQRHELLKVSVVSIDGDAANCFDRLQKMFHPDYEFVLNEIEDRQKKAYQPTSAASS